VCVCVCVCASLRNAETDPPNRERAGDDDRVSLFTFLPSSMGGFVCHTHTHTDLLMS